jgi:hypothetical protein
VAAPRVQFAGPAHRGDSECWWGQLRPGNTAGRVTTAQPAITATITITIMGAAPGIIMADPLTLTTATIPAGRTRTGVMAYPQDFSRIRIGAVTHVVVTKLLLVLHAYIRL